MSQALKNCFDWLLLIAIWCGAIFFLGGAARIAKEIFCLGFGCGG